MGASGKRRSKRLRGVDEDDVDAETWKSPKRRKRGEQREGVATEVPGDGSAGYPMLDADDVDLGGASTQPSSQPLFDSSCDDDGEGAIAPFPDIQEADEHVGHDRSFDDAGMDYSAEEAEEDDDIADVIDSTQESLVGPPAPDEATVGGRDTSDSHTDAQCADGETIIPPNWTEDEKNALFAGISRYGRYNSGAIAAYVGTRTVVEVAVCISAFEKGLADLKRAEKDGHFTPEEKTVLPMCRVANDPVVLGKERARARRKSRAEARKYRSERPLKKCAREHAEAMKLFRRDVCEEYSKRLFGIKEEASAGSDSPGRRRRKALVIHPDVYAGLKAHLVSFSRSLVQRSIAYAVERKKNGKGDGKNLVVSPADVHAAIEDAGVPASLDEAFDFPRDERKRRRRRRRASLRSIGSDDASEEREDADSDGGDTRELNMYETCLVDDEASDADFDAQLAAYATLQSDVNADDDDYEEKDTTDGASE